MLTERIRANSECGMVDPAGCAAVSSLLSVVGPGPAAYLLKTARERTAGVGEIVVAEEQSDQAGVLIDGLLRTVVSMPDGRAATIHYTSPVEFFGLPTIFQPVPLSVHVVRKATVVALDGQAVRRCAFEFPEFGFMLSRQLAAAVGRVGAIIDEFGFRSVRERVASHLISLSEPTTRGVRTAHVTQEELAEYVGSAREVVSRCLRSLSDESAVTIGRGSIGIVNEPRLQRLASRLGAGAPKPNPQ